MVKILSAPSATATLPAGADGAAVTGGGGDSEGLRVLLPDNSERRESGTVHIKFDTIGVKFSGYNLRLTGFNGIRHLGLTGNAIFRCRPESG